MAAHDRMALDELIHRWWFVYDEGHLDVLEGLLTDDCRTSSRTELGNHPQEQFIASDNSGRVAVMDWKREHRRNSPYPLRHHAANVFVTAEHGDEVDVESYLFVTQIIDRRPSNLSSGIVRWTLQRTSDGYRVKEQHTVLDSIESAPFHKVDFVAARQKTW